MAITASNDFDPEEVYARMPWLRESVLRACSPNFPDNADESAIMAHLDEKLLAEIRYLPVGGELTPKEKKVLSCLLTGNTVDTIAEQLGKHPDTVKSQLKSARMKLGVTRNWQAAIAAYLLGEL